MQSNPENSTENASINSTKLPTATQTIITNITLDNVTKELLASQERLASYRENLTVAKRRIPNNLLFVIDPNYPPTSEETPAQAKKMMIAKHQLIPAEEAIIKFNLSPSGNQSVGDQVYLYVFLNASAPTNEIDSYVTNVTDREEKMHFAVAWVDLNNLEKLMSVRNVDHIRIVEPPGTDTLI
ncbi:MAG: hypothetical protein M0Q91_11410 [Methanoregula sp.]|jgi:hypothetical protein|nr:hypothetical protein [Methanoregula sp.]